MIHLIVLKERMSILNNMLPTFKRYNQKQRKT